MAPSKMQPAILGGLTLGILSALPIISLGNVCCCLWVLVGGAVAAYVLQANHPEPIQTGDAAVAGLLAGVIGAVVWLIISIPLTLVMGPFQARMMQRVFEGVRDVPEGMRPIVEGMRRGGAGGFRLIALFVQFFFMLIVSAIFSTIGALIGAALFRKKPPILGPDVPPPPPPLPPAY